MAQETFNHSKCLCNHISTKIISDYYKIIWKVLVFVSFNNELSYNTATTKSGTLHIWLLRSSLKGLASILSIHLWVISVLAADGVFLLDYYLFVQSYNRDLFIFLYLLLIIVSAITSFKIHHDKSPFSGKSILYLNRHQTEEWKGWMQVSLLFQMYLFVERLSF